MFHLPPPRAFLVFCLLTALPIGAEPLTQWIAAGATIDLMSGLSAKDKSLAVLSPGTPFKVLKVNQRLGYARIALDSGEIGWIPSKVISAVPVPVSQGPAAIAENQPPKSPEQLREDVSRLQTELIAVRQASSDILRIQTERDQLQSSVIALKRELETTTRAKNALNEDQKQTWFMIGGGVLLIGVILGVLLPRLSFKRRNHWGSY